MKFIKWIIVCILLTSTVIMAIGYKIHYDLNKVSYYGEDVEFFIAPGERFATINKNLHTQGIIDNPTLLYRYVRLKELTGKFKSGTFLIKSNSSLLQVVNTLLYSRPITPAVTIPEGKNIFEIAKLLEEKQITSYLAFVEAAKDRDFVLSLGINAERVEGYLFPNTYRFMKNSDPKEVITQMVKEFFVQLKKANIHLEGAQLHSVIILASIVEKETGAAFERPLIASVFFNRLKKRMRLQSDPTTIYGIFETYNGNIKKEHLTTPSPYNTYTISGLPRGPICNPGIAAIDAVLNPKESDYLYFVSRNDGTHIFSKTYKEHNNAVREYQQTRKNRVNKSWRDLKKKSTDR